jgi:phage terminase small subunit
VPVLQNARWEVMANLMAGGKKSLAAYREAGFSPNFKNASKLANRQEIQDRIREIHEHAVATTTLSVQKVLLELEKIGFSNMMDYIKIDPVDGQPVLDMRNMTREQAAAIGEITFEETTNPRDGTVTRRNKFKLLDKKGALVDLGRYLGMFVERKDIRVGGVMFHVNASDTAL